MESYLHVTDWSRTAIVDLGYAAHCGWYLKCKLNCRYYWTQLELYDYYCTPGLQKLEMPSCEELVLLCIPCYRRIFQTNSQLGRAEWIPYPSSKDHVCLGILRRLERGIDSCCFLPMNGKLLRICPCFMWFRTDVFAENQCYASSTGNVEKDNSTTAAFMKVQQSCMDTYSY